MFGFGLVLVVLTYLLTTASLLLPRRKEYAATLENDVIHLKEKLEAVQAREGHTSSG